MALPLVDRSPQVLIVNVIFWILSWISILLRLYVRAGLLKWFGVDDWTMVITQIFFTAYLSCQLGGVLHGTGRQRDHVPPADYNKALEFWFFCEIFYVISCCTLKISIGLYLLRITIRRIHIWILWCFIISTALFGFAYLCIVLVQCHPLSNWWTAEKAGCIDPSIVVQATYTASALNSLADWTFGILPFFIVRDLNMSRRTKYIAAGILSFAAIGSTATLIRIPFIKYLADTAEFLWSTTGLAVCSTIEVGIGITAGCAATFRPLLKRFASKFDESRSGMPSSIRAEAGSYIRHQSISNPLASRPPVDLDELQPYYNPTTTTTITAGRSEAYPSSDFRKVQSSRERLIGMERNVMIGYSKPDPDRDPKHYLKPGT